MRTTTSLSNYIHDHLNIGAIRDKAKSVKKFNAHNRLAAILGGVFIGASTLGLGFSLTNEAPKANMQIVSTDQHAANFLLNATPDMDWDITYAADTTAPSSARSGYLVIGEFTQGEYLNQQIVIETKPEIYEQLSVNDYCIYNVDTGTLEIGGYATAQVHHVLACIMAGGMMFGAILVVTSLLNSWGLSAAARQQTFIGNTEVITIIAIACAGLITLGCSIPFINAAKNVSVRNTYITETITNDNLLEYVSFADNGAYLPAVSEPVELGVPFYNYRFLFAAEGQGYASDTYIASRKLDCVRYLDSDNAICTVYVQPTSEFQRLIDNKQSRCRVTYQANTNATSLLGAGSDINHPGTTGDVNNAFLPTIVEALILLCLGYVVTSWALAQVDKYENNHDIIDLDEARLIIDNLYRELQSVLISAGISTQDTGRIILYLQPYMLPIIQSKPERAIGYIMLAVEAVLNTNAAQQIIEVDEPAQTVNNAQPKEQTKSNKTREHTSAPVIRREKTADEKMLEVLQNGAMIQAEDSLETISRKLAIFNKALPEKQLTDALSELTKKLNAIDFNPSITKQTSDVEKACTFVLPQLSEQMLKYVSMKCYYSGQAQASKQDKQEYSSNLRAIESSLVVLIRQVTQQLSDVEKSTMEYEGTEIIAATKALSQLYDKGPQLPSVH